MPLLAPEPSIVWRVIEVAVLAGAALFSVVVVALVFRK